MKRKAMRHQLINYINLREEDNEEANRREREKEETVRWGGGLRCKLFMKKIPTMCMFSVPQ